MPTEAAYGAQQIARYFIYLANRESKPITNKKLQKLLYYSQAWAVAGLNKKLFNDKIEAWIHGPAIRDVYLEYKDFGANPINTPVNEQDISLIQPEDKKLLDEVWSVYGKFDAAYLEQLTHSEMPWQEARQGLEANTSSENEIKLDSMKSYYSAKFAKGV